MDGSPLWMEGGWGSTGVPRPWRGQRHWRENGSWTERKGSKVTRSTSEFCSCLVLHLKLPFLWEEKYFNKAFFPPHSHLSEKVNRVAIWSQRFVCLLWILLGTQGLCVLSRFPWVVKIFRNEQLQGKSSGTQSGALLTIFPLAKEVTLPVWRQCLDPPSKGL